MKFDFSRNRGFILAAAVVALIALLSDFFGALSALYAWALTARGQGVLLVAVVLLVVFLVLDRFLPQS